MNPESDAEPSWKGIIALLLIAAIFVWIIASACTPTANVGTKSETTTSAPHVEAGDDADITIITLQNAGRATLVVAGLGWALSFLNGRTRQNAVDRLVRAIEDADENNMTPKNIKQKVASDGQDFGQEGGPRKDATERYIKKRIAAAKPQ